MVKTYFNWDEPLSQDQDVYFAGNGDGIGKIWKNNTLVYSISDTASVIINDMKVVNDSTIYSAGYSYSDFRGHVWTNDSVLFTTDYTTFIERMVLGSNGWTAAGGNTVWQNGETLYEYTIDSTTCNLYALAIDTVTGDIYAGGSIVTPGVYACVWKNDTVFWQCAGWSEVNDLCFDGENLYAAGFVYGAESIDGVVWQNDSIVFQIEGGEINAITEFNGSLYWAGISASDNTAYIWQDGEVLYAHPDCDGFNTLFVNEYGVYYAGLDDDVATLWKDGEILYQPEDCEYITAIEVLPAPPVPVFTLTVEADSTGWGTVTGGGEYYYGDTATIEAFPNVGCEFLYWNDSITDNPRDIVVTQDSTFIAYFGQLQYTITVESDHPEWGDVTGGGNYHYGDTIQIEAFPNLGHVFLGWDDGNTDNPRSIVVTESQTYIALFALQECLVTTKVIPEDAGTVTGGGLYHYGDTLTLTAQNNTGYVFSQWDDGDTDNPRTIIVESDTVFIAVFSPLSYEITTECDPAEGGTVTGAGIYDYGTTAILTATPNDYYSFVCWSDGIVSNPRNVVVTGDAHYKAIFLFNGLPQYTITVTANNPEWGTVTGSGTYPLGTTIEISATPYSDANFTGWDDGVTDNPRSITVTQDMEIMAIFEKIETYTITVRAENPLLGTTYGSGAYPLNQVVTIGATPNTGFYFSGWQDGSMDNPRVITVTGNAEYIASFAPNPVVTYTVTVYFNESQGIVLGTGTYVAGSIATLAAIPAEGYVFQKWGDDTTDNPKEVLVDHDIVLTAFFNYTSVNENDMVLVRLYPNPASDKIHIEGLEGEHEVQIYNAFGLLVKTLSIHDDDEIDLGALSAGLYFLRVDGQVMRLMKK
jgi:hypothetical protein